MFTDIYDACLAKLLAVEGIDSSTVGTENKIVTPVGGQYFKTQLRNTKTKIISTGPNPDLEVSGSFEVDCFVAKDTGNGISDVADSILAAFPDASPIVAGDLTVYVNGVERQAAKAFDSYWKIPLVINFWGPK